MSNNKDIKNTIIFPEIIIGIGGAGKKLVFSLLNKDWILKEMLKPQIGQTIATNYRTITVDTSVDEHHKKDLPILQNIIGNINTIQNDYRKNGKGMPNNLDVECLLLTKNIPLLGEPDIMGKTVVDNIKKATGAKYWWFYPPDIGNDLAQKLRGKENFNNLNFAGGVIRRRALGKGIFYKAISENRIDISRYVSTLGGRVAMVVGLGGGTGSGIFIDYAKKLKENSPNIDITLFAVLPTSHERDKEQANGYVSLCELEYLKTTGELNKLFKDIILLPMEPTMYRDDNDMVQYLMDEFHDAFAYTFISYWDLSWNIPLEGYSYAPFIMASSCIIRYNIESNRKMIEHFNSALLEKINATNIEKDMNSDVNDFLKDYKEGDLEHNDDKWLSNRLTDLKNLLFADSPRHKEFFNKAGYQCFETFENALKRGEGTKNDHMFEKLPSIKVEIGMARMQNARSEIDVPMRSVFNSEIPILEDMIKLFRKISKIQDHNERKILSEVVRKEGPFSESKLWMQEALRDLETKRSQNNENINELDKQLEIYKEKTKEIIGDIKSKITKDINIEQDKLQKIDHRDYREGLKIKLDRLNNELTNYVTEINRKGGQLDAISTNNLRRSLDEFIEVIKPIDNKFSINDILNSADDVKNFRKASIIVKKGIPFLDKSLKVLRVHTGIVNRLKRSEEEKRMFAIRIRDSNIFEIKSDDSIEIIFKYDLESILKERIEDIINDLILKVNNIIKSNFNQQLITEETNKIRNEIKANSLANSLGQCIEDILKDMTKYNVTVIEHDERRGKIVKELENINTKISFLEGLGNLYNNKYERKIYDYNEKIKLFKKNIEDFKNCYAETNVKSQVDDRYVFQIEPQKESNVIGRNNIKDFLNAEQVEYDNLMSKANMIIGNKLFTNKYAGFANQCIEYGADRWSLYSIALFISSLKDIIINKQTELTNIFKITDSRRIGNIIKNVGDIWDVGFTLFVVGTFLDNIIEVTDPTKGYYSSYQKVKTDMKDLIFLHHTHLLEKGCIVQRSVIPIEEENNKKLFASNDDDKILLEIKKHQTVVSYLHQSEEDKGKI